MKKSILFLFSLLLVLSYCSKNDEAIDTFDYFQTHLKADMNYTAIVKTFGEPDSDIGSGIHIYVYLLTDGTSIWVGYTDHILYARHMDSNQQLLHTII